MAGLFLLAAAAATLAFPWALKQLIDQGLTGPGSAERLAGQFAQLFGVAAALALFSAARFYTVTWLGERITAERLHQLGWINQLSNPGESLVQALHLAQRLNARAPNALTGIKDLLNSAAQMPLSDHLAQEKSSFVTLLHHPNALTGINALLNKQTPDYR